MKARESVELSRMKKDGPAILLWINDLKNALNLLQDSAGSNYACGTKARITKKASADTTAAAGMVRIQAMTIVEAYVQRTALTR